MKKISIALILAVTLILCTTTVFAEHYWNDGMKFSAANGTINVDGKIDAGEWDDAQAISIKLNNDPLDASGNINYQGEWGDGDRNDSDYSGIYKIKWDDKYIYYLEDRTDNHVNLSSNGEQPWTTDGALIFTQVDSADGKLNPSGISVHVFYSVGNEGTIGGSLKARICNIEDGSRETVDIPGGIIASALKAGGYIVEIAVPWAYYTSLVPNFKGPSAGDKMGLSYVVHDSDTDDAGYVKQLCYAIDNDNLGDVPGGYDFGGWGVLELSAPVAQIQPTEPTPEQPAPSPDAPTPTPSPAPAPAAPATGDNNMVIVFAVLAAAVFTFTMSKRRSINVK